MAFVGRRPCGCVGYLSIKSGAGAAHANQRRREGRDLMQLLRDGWTVETMTVGEARRLPLRSRCEHMGQEVGR